MRAPLWQPLLLVLLGSAALAALNVHNAAHLAPHWGQDLAFFTQICWSAVHGGPWSSPLLHEPLGFFAMVHTHLVLPLVVASYALIPRQEVLLCWQGLFAGLALWPAFRLGEAVARERGVGRPALVGALAAASLLLLGPVQAAGSADFRPNVLFLPGLVGVFAAAREGRTGQALLWSLLAQAGRQEASYFLLPAGLALCLLPWGGARRWRTGLGVVAFALLCFGAWVALKPQMFFHFDPRSLVQEAPPVEPDFVQARWAFLGRLVRSGAALGLLQPAALVAGLPLAAQLARDSREWTAEVGPSVQWHAFWLGYAVPAMVAGAVAWPRRLGGAAAGLALLWALNATAFPWQRPREGPVAALPLVAQVPPEARVAADHDTIAALAGREVLWNVASLHLREDQRPYGLGGPWPLTVDMVDILLVDEGHPVLAHATSWRLVDRVELGDGRTKGLWARE
ncbi:DUF2079 domain-containing protein [Myxococcota bacterium]|nr:DUF2079 domain-containing protein [Myxococcota bacterium]